MSSDQSDTQEWQRATFAGRFQPPGLPTKLKSGVTGVISESGVIESDELSADLVLEDQDAIEPGTEVRVTLRRGHAHAIPVDELERLQTAKRAKHRYKEWRRRRKQEAREEQREQFWEQYKIPIEFTTGQNSRLGELQRGSTGTGRTEHTATHFVVLEEISEGRLEREEREFLCRQEGRFPDRPTTGKNDEQEPKVTCETCLDRMDRWAVDQPED